jgi:geranylgeranyl pyrophosphate synthase
VPPEERPQRLKRIHALKTGRLIRLSVELGALHAGADEAVLAGIGRFGDAIGLLFQIADDLLDVTQDSATLGKTAGKDAEQDKLTYPAVFGLEGALRERDRALEEAHAAAAGVEGPRGLLAALAEYVAGRDR